MLSYSLRSVIGMGGEFRFSLGGEKGFFNTFVPAFLNDSL